MGNIGPGELLIIALIALLLFGAGRIADIGKGLGQGISNFKKGLKEGDGEDEDEDEKKPTAKKKKVDEPAPKKSAEKSKVEKKKADEDEDEDEEVEKVEKEA
jgi:sec-independent protein translocase protein TatA